MKCIRSQLNHNSRKLFWSSLVHLECYRPFLHSVSINNRVNTTGVYLIQKHSSTAFTAELCALMPSFISFILLKEGHRSVDAFKQGGKTIFILMLWRILLFSLTPLFAKILLKGLLLSSTLQTPSASPTFLPSLSFVTTFFFKVCPTLTIQPRSLFSLCFYYFNGNAASCCYLEKRHSLASNFLSISMAFFFSEVDFSL